MIFSQFFILFLTLVHQNHRKTLKRCINLMFIQAKCTAEMYSKACFKHKDKRCRTCPLQLNIFVSFLEIDRLLPNFMMQEFMGRNLLALNVMWKYREQVS
jgi:hypothetical protein